MLASYYKKDSSKTAQFATASEAQTLAVVTAIADKLLCPSEISPLFLFLE